MSILPRRFPLLFIPCLLLPLATGLVPSSAFADELAADAIPKAIDSLANQDRLSRQELVRINMEAAQDAADKMADIQAKIDETRMKEAQPKDADLELTLPMKSQISADALGQVMVNDIMTTRMKQLEGVSLAEPNVPVAPYLLDTTSSTDFNTQNFRIYMSYFCDPKELGGLLAYKDNNGTATSNERQFPILQKNGTTYYNISCGKSESGESREDMLGSGDETMQKIRARNQIKGLPLDVSRLFFEPTTYPKIDLENPNSNPTAELYFGAIMQSIQLLTGSPEKAPGLSKLTTATGKGEYVEFQRRNTRKALASYPFAILASERMSSIPKETAASIATLLQQRLDSTDPIVNGYIKELQTGTGMSMAEYQKIMMHDIPLSSGYLQKVKTNKNARDLKGELVYLEGLSLAQGYDLGKWMRILMAIEAADSQNTLTVSAGE